MVGRIRSWKIAVVGLLVGSILLAATGCGANQAAAQTDTSRRSITVIGNGRATAKPDVAHAQIGVDIRDASVETASSQANDRTNKVVQALKDMGIDDKDIQTANYNIWVEQNYGDKGQPSGQPMYHAVSNVNVAIHDLSKVGSVLDAAIKAGANSVSGVSFSISDPSALESEARTKAVANAKARATELAQQAGVQVGGIQTISEVIGQQPPVPYAMDKAAMAGGGGAPIQPGELETSVQVQVTFAIQ